MSTKDMSKTKMDTNEARAIRSLRALAKRWPKSLWLFTNGQSLCVMQKKDGRRVVTKTGGMDADYSLASINIESDGGDW